MSLDLAARLAVLEQKFDRLVKPERPPFGIGCRVYNNANISVAHDTWTSLTFNTERFDTDAMHDTGVNPGRLTCVHAGVYLITGYAAFAANATGTRRLGILLGGATTIARMGYTATPATSETHVFIAAVYELAVGDYVELQAYQGSGGALNVVVLGNYSPEFSMVRLA